MGQQFNLKNVTEDHVLPGIEEVKVFEYFLNWGWFDYKFSLREN